jgi:hypothetical protein
MALEGGLLENSLLMPWMSQNWAHSGSLFMVVSWEPSPVEGLEKKSTIGREGVIEALSIDGKKEEVTIEPENAKYSSSAMGDLALKEAQSSMLNNDFSPSSLSFS